MKNLITIALLCSNLTASYAGSAFPITDMSVAAGIMSMDREYKPMTCADIGNPDECFDTETDAYLAMIERAVEVEDWHTVEYYSALLDGRDYECD